MVELHKFCRILSMRKEKDLQLFLVYISTFLKGANNILYLRNYDIERSCNIPVFVYQILFCRVQGFPGRAIGAAAGEKKKERKKQRYSALGFPFFYQDSCIFICFIN
jgi:hypothetical protein